MTASILTAENLALISALRDESLKEASQTAFARDYLPFSVSKWSKIADALDPEKESYFDEVSPEAGRAILDQLRAALADLPRLRSQFERANNVPGIIELAQFTAVRKACEAARAKRNPERLIKYLAPTGGGKTMLCSWLATKCNARVVESRESWKDSYTTFLVDVARAISCRLDGERRRAPIEDAIIATNQRILLAVDEAEYFGPAALNGLKLILNKTNIVVVLAAISEAHDRWNRYYPLEASQLDRRTHAVIRLTTIAADDLAPFFPPRQFDDRAAGLARIAEEATRFGAYSLVARIAARLEGKEKVDSTELEKAIKSALREMNRSR